MKGRGSVQGRCGGRSADQGLLAGLVRLRGKCRGGGGSGAGRVTLFSCRQALLALPLLLLLCTGPCVPQLLGIRGDGKLHSHSPQAGQGGCPEHRSWESGPGLSL